MKTCYVFNRIPKTGSVSANTYLTNLARRYKLKYYKGHGVSASQLVKSTCGWMDRPDYISGHLPYSIIEPLIRSKFNCSTLTFSILRDPIARLQSHIAHFWFELLQCINHEDLIWSCNPELPITEDIRNFQVRWLVNWRYGPKLIDANIQSNNLKNLRINNLIKNTSIVPVSCLDNHNEDDDCVYLGLLGYKSTDSNLVNGIAECLTHNLDVNYEKYDSSEFKKMKNQSIRFLSNLSKACIACDKDLCEKLLIKGSYSKEATHLLEKAIKICQLFKENNINSILSEDLEYWNYCKNLVDNVQDAEKFCIKLNFSGIL